MRHFKLIRTIMAVILLLWGLLFYSPARATTVTFPSATRDVGAKMWPARSYYADYDDGNDDSGGDDSDDSSGDDGSDDNGDDAGGDD